MALGVAPMAGVAVAPEVEFGPFMPCAEAA